MAVVEVRTINRRYARGDLERVQISGGIQVTGQQGTLRAGSFQLRHVDQIVLGPATGMANGSAGAALRGIAGSVRDPNSTYANSIRLRAFIAGTTGTRLVTGAGVIGSTPVSGAVSAPFIVFGH